MNEIRESILSVIDCSGYSKLMSNNLKAALSEEIENNRSAKFKYLLTFPNKEGIPKEKFADKIFSIIAQINVEYPPKEDNKWKSWFYLVEESYKTEGKHIHVFVWLTYSSTNWDSIKSRFTLEIDKTICSPYILPIGTANWTSVLLYLTKEDASPIYSLERQDDIINYFNTLKEKSLETEELRVNLSNVLKNMRRHQESNLVKSYFKIEKGLGSEEEVIINY
jgi:hypothetical protein